MALPWVTQGTGLLCSGVEAIGFLDLWTGPPQTAKETQRVGFRGVTCALGDFGGCKTDSMDSPYWGASILKSPA